MIGLVPALKDATASEGEETVVDKTVPGSDEATRAVAD